MPVLGVARELVLRARALAAPRGVMAHPAGSDGGERPSAQVHEAAVLADGSVWLRGQTAHALSFSHRLFPGEHDRPRRIPRSAFGGHCAVVVACGKRHTLVLCTDGRAWTAGCNLYAQLGYSAAGHREHFACEVAWSLQISQR